MLKEKIFPENFIESVAILLFASAGSFILFSLSLFLYPTIDIQLMYLANIVLFVFGSWVINKRRKKRLSFDFNTEGLKLLPLLLCVIFFYLMGFSFPMSDLYENLLKPTTGGGDISTAFFLGAIILGPIIEEIMFRNIILKGMLNTYKPQKAIILSSILFAVIHIKPFMVFNAFLLGLFFGWIFYKTRNLTITIAMHSFANFVASFPGFLKSKSPDNKLLTVFEIYNEHQFLFAIVAFVALCVSLLYLNMKFKKLLISKSIKV